MKDLNLLEILKEMRQDDVEYSCYSSTYQTYYQIEIQKKNLSCIKLENGRLLIL